MDRNAPVSLILPYFNEAEYLEATLASLAAQTDRRFSLILVDNASSDESREIAGRVSEELMPDIAATFLEESRPGKLFALATGMAAADTPIVATIDADTIYPQTYVAKVIDLFAAGDDIASVLAFGMDDQSAQIASAKLQFFARLFPRKCHTGGFGQSFDRVLLEKAGGFDPGRWPYVLEDHEIIHRIGKLGKLSYSSDLVCFPSDRRSDRTDCSWTLFERVLYKLMPQSMMDWFFYRFLARRFEKRGLRNIKLREKSWNERQP